MTAELMVATFQCPGCAHGEHPGCGRFELGGTDGGPGADVACRNHRPGSQIRGMWVNLGLPVPMARGHYADGDAERRTKICLHPHSPDPNTLWGDDRVPTWAMERGGFLLVRVYEPRRDRTWVDVVQGGTVDQVRTVGGPAVRDLSAVANRMDL